MRSSLADLRSWLGHGAVLDGWLTFLSLPVIDEQLTKGNDADPVVVTATIKQLDSGTPGLEKPRFAHLRDALVTWSGALIIGKVQGSLSAAAPGFEVVFRPTTEADVAASKAALVDAAGKLGRFLKARTEQAGEITCTGRTSKSNSSPRNPTPPCSRQSTSC